MSEVHVKEGESLDSALKRFKRSCAKAGVLAEVRKRECYESPSVKRRKKSEAARKNRNKRYEKRSAVMRGLFYLFYCLFDSYCKGIFRRRSGEKILNQNSFGRMSSTSGYITNAVAMPSFSAASSFRRIVCASSKRRKCVRPFCV